MAAIAKKLASLVVAAFVSAVGAGANAKSLQDEQLNCMALNIYHEARGESLEGMLAVATATMNRVETRGFPNTICGVVKQNKSRRKVLCQFSWWCDGRSDRPQEASAWTDSIAMAKAVVYGGARYPDADIASSDHYVRCDIKPKWVRNMRFSGRVGSHCFYRDPRSVYSTGSVMASVYKIGPDQAAAVTTLLTMAAKAVRPSDSAGSSASFDKLPLENQRGMGYYSLLAGIVFGAATAGMTFRNRITPRIRAKERS